MSRTPRICGEPKPTGKCLERATTRGKCPEHAPAPFEGARDRWKAARPPGESKIRRTVIRRASGRCEAMGCTSAGAQVDHIKPVAEGGTWALENLQYLCKPHHSIKTAEDAKRGKARKAR